MANSTAQSHVDISAPPELVYDLIADVPAMAGWAAEVNRNKWLDGAAGPAVGARFRGVNKHRGRIWATVCTVTAAEAPSRFEFLVRVAGLPTAKWRYHIEATGSGCRVTESTRRLSPRPVAVAVNLLGLGIRDRDAHNQRNIERTLARLKAHAESLAASPPSRS